MFPKGIRRIALAVVLLVSSDLPALLSWQSSQEIFVGVLRTDGLLIPTAIFDGKEWWNPWPFSGEDDDTVRNLPLPPSLDDLPPDWLPPGVTLPRDWRLQAAAGPASTVRLSRFARPTEFTMAAFIGISTDYPSRPPVPGTSDVEIGPVISGPASLGRLRELSAGEGRSLVSTLRREFDLAEDRAIAERIKLDYDAGPWRFPADQQQRAGKPLTIDQVMVDERQHDGNTLYYLTAVKAYARKAPSPCDVFVDFAVVIIRDQRGRVRSPGINAYTAFDCSRSPEGVAPLASVHWAGAPLWLVRINVDGGYDYALLDPLRAPGRPQTVQLKGLWPLRRPRNR